MAKVSKSDIVSTGKRVLPAGHPDLLWYDPSEVIIVGEESAYSNTAPALTASSRVTGGSITSSAVGASGASKVVPPIVKPDVPDLSDIEEVILEEYRDEVTKALFYRAKVKIRNSSSNKNNIAGVDARIEP